MSFAFTISLILSFVIWSLFEIQNYFLNPSISTALTLFFCVWKYIIKYVMCLIMLLYVFFHPQYSFRSIAWSLYVQCRSVPTLCLISSLFSPWLVISTLTKHFYFPQVLISSSSYKFRLVSQFHRYFVSSIFIRNPYFLYSFCTLIFLLYLVQ